MCKKVWNYHPDEPFQTESHDSYWSMYENHVYDKHELQSYECAQVYSLITSYIDVTNDTKNITGKPSSMKEELNLETLETEEGELEEESELEDERERAVAHLQAVESHLQTAESMSVPCSIS